MLKQYIHFFINGVFFGLVTWAGQYYIYLGIGDKSSLSYGLATSLAYGVMLAINFFIVKKYIFKAHGKFLKYIIVDVAILILVSFLSPLCRMIIAVYFGTKWGDIGGFAVASVLTSIPSFLLKRYWVFPKNVQL